MKKLFVIFVLSLISGWSFSQLISGTVVESKRKMLSDYDFKIKGKYDGVKYFELAVNNEGKVTGIKEEVKENCLISTPAKLIAQRDLDQLEFEKGTHFPKFQHVLVRVEFIKE